jgi:hypothetical protein
MEDIMKKAILAACAVLALGGSSAVYAQQHGSAHHAHRRMSADDMSAFADARIAAIKAGLRLTPEQEKNWPALEAAVKDFAKLRIDRANARATARDARRAEDRNERRENHDPVTRLRERADNMAGTAAALKKIADAADPLYKSLDEGQKRRLSMLTRMERGFGMRGMWRHHERRGGFERDHERSRDRDSGSERSPERL